MSHELPDDLYHVVNDLIDKGAVPKTRLHDQIYMHSRRGDGLPMVWDVEKLKKAARLRGKRASIGLDQWYREAFETNKANVDVDYALSLPREKTTAPVILGTIADSAGREYEWVMDGVHRLYRAWRDGHKTFPAWRLSLADSDACRFSDEDAVRAHACGGMPMGPGDL